MRLEASPALAGLLSGLLSDLRRPSILLRAEGVTTGAAANALSDYYAAQPHPIWGHRSQAIINSLLRDSWHTMPQAGSTAATAKPNGVASLKLNGVASGKYEGAAGARSPERPSSGRRHYKQPTANPLAWGIS